MDPIPPDSPYSAPPSLSSLASLAPPPASVGFGVGDLLKQTFSIYGASFAAFTLISALVSIPSILCTVLLGVGTAGNLLGILLSALSGPIGTGAITYGVLEHLRGEPKSVGESLSVGLGKALSVLGVSLLVGLCVAGGLLLCILPGLYVAIVLAVAVPVAVQEKLSGTEALRRSASLTAGHRDTIFTVLFVISLVTITISIGLLLVYGFRNVVHPERQRLWGEILSIPVAALGSTAAAVMYDRLRNIKEAESVGLHDIAPVSG